MSTEGIVKLQREMTDSAAQHTCEVVSTPPVSSENENFRTDGISHFDSDKVKAGSGKCKNVAVRTQNDVQNTFSSVADSPKLLNSFPDSPISNAESSDSNEVPAKRIVRRKPSSSSKVPKKIRRKHKNNVYEVEYILDYVECGADALYLVKWKDWAPEHNSWEPKQNVTNCKEVVDKYFSSVYGASAMTREQIDAYGQSLVQPTKQPLEELMTSLVQQGKLEYEVPSLRKVCMALSSLLSVPEEARSSERVDSVKKDILLRQLHVKRSRQLKSLKEWEVEINASSSATARISVENKVDLEGPPENFYYVNDYIPGEGVTIPEDPPVGCNCKWCNAETCSCVKETGNRFAYNYNKTVRVGLNTPIYECNKLCSCSEKCNNRVVQSGCHVKLSIFRTSTGCGWGVKALENIEKGTYICEYVGEVITSEEAEKRGRKYDAEGQTYLFDLDYNQNEEGHCPYSVDAAFLGNVSHFINHSCNPNLQVYAVWVNCLDPDLPKLAFFARRKILQEEEITFDYKSQPRTSSISSNTPCKCGSSKCRKYLF